jgi:sec-independent protein translocase protein TatC
MRKYELNHYSDDPFAATRMSFGEHLEDLRRHLIWALAGFVVVLVLVFVLDFVGLATGTSIGVAKPMRDAIALPVERELQHFFDRRARRVLANLANDPALKKANRPTPFVRLGFDRAQLQAALEGRPADEVNRFMRPVIEGEDGPTPLEEARAITADDIYQLWVRAEEPLREAALRHEAERQVARRPTLATMSLTEGMMVYVKVALACGVVLGSPWILWHLWAFVAAGLYAHEKRPVYIYLPFSLGLFLGGIAVCQFLVMPRAVEALLWFNEWLDLEPDLRLSEWVGFAVLMPVVFGVSFQTPLAILVLERLGIVSAAGLRQRRRLAWFLLAVLAAVITPSIDPSMLFLWLPMGLLYELGILLCEWTGHGDFELDPDEPALDGRVEA